MFVESTVSSDEVYSSSVVGFATDERGAEVFMILLGLLPRSILVCRGVLSIQPSRLNLETFSSIFQLM